jgi:hypothetical protein
LDYFIQSASSAKYGIILVDACRNNPLVKYFQKGRHKGSNAKKGLGQVTPTVGQVVIGFATSAGDTADDGTGKMSPYATALAHRLKEKDDIRNILGKVADDVSKKYEQNPIYRANLASSVFLNGSNIYFNTSNTSTPENLSQSFINTLNAKDCNSLKIFFINPFLGDGKLINQDNFQNYCQRHYLINANKNLKIESVFSMEILKRLDHKVANKIQKKVNSLNENYDELLFISLSGKRASKYWVYRMDLIVIRKENKYYVVGEMR